jgi:hypothetical protein
VKCLVIGPVVVALLTSGNFGFAQTQQPAKAPPISAPHSPTIPPAPTRKPIELGQALYLIRSTLLTLNDANRSGNYTVLRDVAAPGFQARNSAADLAITFTDLRKRNFDLFGVALLAPQLSAVPQVDVNNTLRLTGRFPTQPLQIAFDLLYEISNRQWRLLGISITTPEAPVVAANKANDSTGGGKQR